MADNYSRNQTKSNEAQLQKVLTDCILVAFNDLVKTSVRTIPLPPAEFVSENNVLYRLDVEGGKAVSKALESLRSNPLLYSYYSDSDFLDGFQEVLLYIYRTRPINVEGAAANGAAKIINVLLEGLATPRTFPIIIPIMGMHVPGPPIKIGQILLVRDVEEALNRWAKNSWKVNDTIGSFLYDTCAVIEVKASNSVKATKVGVENTQSALNALLLYRYGLYYRGMSDIKPYVGMKRANWSEPVTVIVFNPDGAIISSEQGGTVLPDSIGDEFLAAINAEGFNSWSKVLAKNAWERSEIENLVLTAANFCVKGFLEEIESQALVDFIIGLEVLFSPKGRNKGEMLAKRVMQIVLNDGYEGINPPVGDFVKVSYIERNKIVHQGETSIGELNVTRLGVLCFRCIAQTIKVIERIANRENFEKALDDGILKWQYHEIERF